MDLKNLHQGCSISKSIFVSEDLILDSVGHTTLASRILNAPVAQLDRVLDYESSGRRFDSFPARHFSLSP